MADHTKQDEGERRVAIVSGSTGKPISNSRRRFLSNAGMFSAGLVGSSLLAACSDNDFDGRAMAQDDGVQTDIAVLNFALNLEYLEAEYYLRAVTGNGLDTINGDSSGQVMVPQNTMVSWTGEPLVQRYAGEIASDELAHVRALQSTIADLGGTAVQRPAINLQSSFTAAATAALGTITDVTVQDGFMFDPFSSPLAFLIGAFIFEDVGVTAYKGGAPLISNSDVLSAAAGLLSVEAYHAGLVRTVLTSRADEIAVPSSAGVSRDVTVEELVNAISDARDSLDGERDIDQGIGNTTSGINSGTMVNIDGTSYPSSNIVPTNDLALTYSRTTQQVHNIVYLTPNAVGPAMGTMNTEDSDGNTVGMTAFFPEGTNGTFTASGAPDQDPISSDSDT